MSDVDITMFKSEKKINGKVPSRQIIDYSNWHNKRKPGPCLYGQHSNLCQDTRRTGKEYKTGTPTIMRQWSIPKTKEMQIQQDSNWIPQTYC